MVQDRFVVPFMQQLLLLVINEPSRDGLGWVWNGTAELKSWVLAADNASASMLS